MTRPEEIPSYHPTEGVFVGTLLQRYPRAAAEAALELAASPIPAEEVPIENPYLCHDFAEWTAFNYLDHGDPTERQMVAWRGLYAAYKTILHTPKVRWPLMREEAGRVGIDPDIRFRPLVRQATQCAYNYQDIFSISDSFVWYVDPTGNHPQAAELGVLAGFAMLENGEREIQAEFERQRRETAEIRELNALWES